MSQIEFDGNMNLDRQFVLGTAEEKPMTSIERSAESSAGKKLCEGVIKLKRKPKTSAERSAACRARKKQREALLNTSTITAKQSLTTFIERSATKKSDEITSGDLQVFGNDAPEIESIFRYIFFTN